jgi:hypothetical protein
VDICFLPVRQTFTYFLDFLAGISMIMNV